MTPRPLLCAWPLALALVACAHAPAPVSSAPLAAPVPPPPAPEKVAAAPAEPPAPVGPCGEEIHGARPLLRPGGLLVFGELPGSAEIPAFIGRMACFAVQDGVPVLLGVELPRDAQPEVDRYLASGGAKEDVVQLVAHKFWSRMWQDGRSSQAVVALLERARVLKAEGKPISVVAYDVKNLDGNARQEAMAEHLLRARAQAGTGTLTVVLSGNVQARTVRGAEWDKELVPLGARLLAAEPGMKALDAQYSGGMAWTCQAAGGTHIDCRPRLVGAPQRSRFLGTRLPSSKTAKGYERHKLYIRVDSEASVEGYHGLFYVGRLSPSPPAAEAQP
ncbi:MAG TPA: hypothetical protein VK447_00295 [Myxococcaceae bacterium]|nr:hypothetical protein [Myxococcaceae bacterium]